MACEAGLTGIAGGRVANSRRGGGLATLADRHMPWLLVLPATLLILALSIYPLLFSVWVAFVNYDFEIPGHAFIGLHNFAEIIQDPLARSSLVNTILLSVADVLVEFLLGLALALAMAPQFRGRGVLMSLFIVPLFISPVIVGQLWSLLLQRPFGPTNYILSQLLGHEVTISWLTTTPWNFIALVIADMWQWTPFIFVILLSGLSTIAPQLYEAAALDGATAWQAFRYVTVPQLLPLMLLAITFRLLDAVKLFDIIYVMTGGGPGSSTYTASFYLYQTGFQQFHLSKATAGSWIFLALTAVVITVLVRRLLRREIGS